MRASVMGGAKDANGQVQDRRERAPSGVFLKAGSAAMDQKPGLLAQQTLEERETQRIALLAKPIRELDWPVYVADYLERHSRPTARYVHELVRMTEKQVSPYALPRRALVHWVQRHLRALGLRLGMKLDEATVAMAEGWIAGEAKRRIMDEKAMGGENHPGGI